MNKVGKLVLFVEFSVDDAPARKARERILELRAKGLTINAIARTLGCTRRRVFQVIAEARAAAESNR